MLHWKNKFQRDIKQIQLIDFMMMPIYGVIVAFVNTAVYFYWLIPNYANVELFLNLVFMIANMPAFIGKRQKFTAILYFYFAAILAFPGMSLMSINLTYSMYYVAIISFSLYCLTFKKSAYISIASLSITFAFPQIDSALVPGEIQEAINLWMALNFGFIVIGLATWLYPERDQEKVELAFKQILFELQKSLLVTDMDAFYKSQENLSVYLGQIDTFSKQIKGFECNKIINAIRPAFLTINYIRRIRFDDPSLVQFSDFLISNKLVMSHVPSDDNLLLADAKKNLMEQMILIKKLIEQLYE